MAVENLTATSRGDKPTTEPVTTNYGLNCFESTVAVFCGVFGWFYLQNGACAFGRAHFRAIPDFRR
jgi:hypothetical protein